MLTHPIWYFLRNLLGIVSVLLLSAGCTQLLPFSLNQPSEVGLNLQVTASETPGIYAIAGNAALPDHIQITVAAVRYLYPGNSTAITLNPSPTYSILDYQSAEVNHGAWQTTLNLWQVDPTGNYRETWQLEQPKLGLALKPTNDVIFLATLTPPDQLPKLEQQLASRRMRLAKGIVRSTNEGDRYAQAEQIMAIALPTGSTVPPSTRLEDVNFGWGYRYLIPQEPQNPDTLEFPQSRQTNAPPAPDELLR